MIEIEPSEKQRLLLWRLAVAGGGAWLSELAKGLSDKPVRDSLIQSRLICEAKLTRRVLGKRAVRSTYVTLEDRGWAWLADHMDLPIWKSKSASEVLQALLAQLNDYMTRHQISLGEVLTQIASPLPEQAERVEQLAGDESSEMSASQSHLSVREQIAQAYAALASHGSNSRVRLAALRSKLTSISRQEVDHALQEMARDGEVVLNRLDNPAEITKDDEEAMIRTGLGDPRHIMHMRIATDCLA